MAGELRGRRGARHRRSPTFRLGLDRPGVVWVHGAAVPVERRPGRAVARLRDGRVVVGGGGAEAGRALERWYRREARARLGELVRVEAAALGVEPGSLTVRDQRTRWGSCSSRGTLSFSWRLLVCPRDVTEYVVVHELCHLRELNHSGAFWRLVEAARPGYREQMAWLREHGPEVQAYRPAPPPATA